MNKSLKTIGLGTFLLLVGLLTACAPFTSVSTSDGPDVGSQAQDSGVEVLPEPSISEAPLLPEQELDEMQEEAVEETGSNESSNEKDSARADDSPEPDSVSTISLSEVRANNSREKCWIVLLGNVYNFTPVVQQHPFGAQLSNAVCGEDATDTFRQNTDIKSVVDQLSPLFLGPVS